MKNILNFLYSLILLFVKDVLSLVKTQSRCDVYDILQIIAFGLMINSIYGVMKDINWSDFYITMTTSYAIMRLRKDIKEHKC